MEVINKRNKYEAINKCNTYIDAILQECEGCSERFKVEHAIFSTFNHLSTFFPEAYAHMLNVWGLESENHRS